MLPSLPIYYEVHFRCAYIFCFFPRNQATTLNPRLPHVGLVIVDISSGDSLDLSANKFGCFTASPQQCSVLSSSPEDKTHLSRASAIATVTVAMRQPTAGLEGKLVNAVNFTDAKDSRSAGRTDAR
ncbi:unnamed protein product [Protopolystoma xenopodis]|uniref:Uncharacterized protein n=1 Tax=Protopolystoma xenopodis TaxID=117903 RepID=A0A3S5B1Q7_9PLAT|nr:unnamed protein product [Protopolystoma xenopodis]